MPRKKGSKNKTTTAPINRAKSLTTEEEIYALDQICQRFESMNEDQRIRAAFFIQHKYPEYFISPSK
jgi:hypothetical protein